MVEAVPPAGPDPVDMKFTHELSLCSVPEPCSVIKIQVRLRAKSSNYTCDIHGAVSNKGLIKGVG